MKILLGVCGSISAYKSVDLSRSLQRQGHEVKVILTKGSLEFVKPEVFGYLNIPAYLPQSDFGHAKVLHIDLARECDMLVIAPASANTLSKLAHGACDDLLSSIYLSLESHKNKIICPAMNTLMLENPMTQKNLKSLADTGAIIVDSNEGVLACGEVGSGKLPDVRELSELIPILCPLSKKEKVVITAGATIANIDSVRFVTNPARGGSAYLLAKEGLRRGYKVHVVEGHDVIEEFKYLRKHPNYSFEKVHTTQELLETVKKLSFDIYLSPMAVSDLDFPKVTSKLKKKELSALPFSIAPDVLAHVVNQRKPNQKIIGFAAESSLAPEVILEKTNRKPVDLLVANLADSGLTGNLAKGFGTTHGTYKLVEPGKRSWDYENLSKEALSKILFNYIENGDVE